MTRLASLKVGLYFSHYECFGHTSRAIAIAQVFKKKFPQGSFFFIQGGVDQPMANLDALGKVYRLPSPFADRRIFRGEVIHAGTHAATRAAACVEILEREQPDVLITEFFPLGREECRHELIPMLIKASAKRVALWAVAGYPLLVGDGQGWRDQITKLYQKILIFAPSMEKEAMAAAYPQGSYRQCFLDFFTQHAAVIEFAGYFLPEGRTVTYEEDVNIPKPPVPPGACRIAVVRGGGAVYPKIVAEAIRAGDVLGKRYYLTVVAGPSTTPQEWYLFATLVAKNKTKNVALTKAVVDYEGLIRDSDACVATASYHTAVMLMKHRKKAVIIPFEGYDHATAFREQPIRAAMLQEHLGARVLTMENLTAARMAQDIQEALQQPLYPALPSHWFTGADVLDKALTGLLSR